MNEKLLIIGVLIFFGIVAITMAYFDTKSMNKGLKDGISTDGELKGYEYSRGGSENSATYFPIVAYKTIEGKAIESYQTFGFSRKKIPVGSKIKIKYQLSDPEHFEIKGENPSNSFFWTVVAGVVFFICVVSYLIYFQF